MMQIIKMNLVQKQQRLFEKSELIEIRNREESIHPELKDTVKPTLGNVGNLDAIEIRNSNGKSEPYTKPTFLGVTKGASNMKVEVKPHGAIIHKHSANTSNLEMKSTLSSLENSSLRTIVNMQDSKDNI